MYEEGNIISIAVLFEEISKSEYSQGKDRKELIKSYMASQEKIIIDCMKSVKGKLGMQKHTFELFGYDFIIDEFLNTILIECNTNPCLEESNTLLKNLLPRMVDDMMNIVMDPLFGPNAGNEEKCKKNYKSKFNLPGSLFGPDNIHEGYKDD